MAIAGYYDPAGAPAPWVEARVHLLRLAAAGPVHFLLDTGADFTSLHLDDMREMGVDLDALTGERVSVVGVGGFISYVQEPAVVSFKDIDAGGWRYFPIQIDLYAPEESDATEAARGLPSLLGRDILNRCTCFLDPSQGSVVLEPFEDVGFLPDPSR